MKCLEVLESGDKTRKQLEKFAKDNKFNQMDMYVALKLWIYALEKTELVVMKKPIEDIIPEMVDSIKLKKG